MHKKFLRIIISLYFLATILGFINVLKGNFSGIAWVFAPLGIFIWGDALILGPFITSICLWLYFKNKTVWTGLFFSTFAGIRSFIETVYALNAQFSDTIRPWETNWASLEIVKPLGKQEIFVIWQLIFTCIFILSTLSFVHFLRGYLKR